MNYDTEKFQAWTRKGHWSNWERKKDRTEDLRFLVVCACKMLKSGEHMTTTQLVERILPGLDDTGRLYVSSGLQYLRKHKMLDGLWVQGKPNGRTFGNAAIIWRSAIDHVILTGTEGLEDVL